MKANFVIYMLIVGTVAQAFPSYIDSELLLAPTDPPGPGEDEDYDPDPDYGTDSEKSPIIASELLVAQTDPPGPGLPDDYDYNEGTDLEKSTITILGIPKAQTDLDRSRKTSEKIKSPTPYNDGNSSLSNENQSLQDSDPVALSNDKKDGDGLLTEPATSTTSRGANEPELIRQKCEVWRKKYEELEKSYVQLSLRYTNELMKQDPLLKVAGSSVHLNMEELSAGVSVTLPSSDNITTKNEIRHLQCRPLDKKKGTQRLLCTTSNYS